MELAKLCLWLQLLSGFLTLEFIYCAPTVYCESPPAIQHGTVSGIKSGDFYLPYDEIEIKCEDGYKYTSTTEFLLCEEDGNWEEEFGACVEILCDPPEPLVNGVIPELINSNLPIFPYNFGITYKCNQGYRLLEGDSWRYCSKSGWSGKTPHCKEITCPDPGAPEHGDREGINFQVGSKVRFKCFSGYNMLGSFERYCMPNGQWTGELTRCDNPGNYCPNPGIPINGFKNGANYDIGDSVRYHCQPGYILLGSEFRECLFNKTWSGTEVRCIAPYDFDNYAQMSEMLKFKVTKKFGDGKQQQQQYPMFIQMEDSRTTSPKPPTMKEHYGLPMFVQMEDSHAISPKPPTSENHDGLTFDTIALWSWKNFQPDSSEILTFSTPPPTTLQSIVDLSYNRRLILHFAFDVSGSVGPLYLRESIEFAKAIVKKVGISRDGTRASAIVFSSEAKIVFYPMQIDTEEEVLSLLNNITFTGGGTSASSAFALLQEIIQTSDEYFGRNYKEDIVFIITDGKINMGGYPEMEAKALKKRNVDIYCIGITGDPRIENLYKIASTSRYGDIERVNVFILQNYATLSYLVQEIVNGTLDFSECGLGLENIAITHQDDTENGVKKKEPWPWMAALYFLIPKSGYEIQCGGTIIKENFILTAAHCMFLKDRKRMTWKLREKNDITVKIGLFNLNDESKVQEFGVKQIFIHEKYDPGNFSFQLYDYDIAILELDGSIEYGRYVRPICLPPQDLPENSSLYSSKEYGWAGGWGHKGILNPYNPNLQNVQIINSPNMKEISLPIQSRERCSKSLEQKSNPIYFTDRMFCAGTGKNGEDTCLGDSGGPLMQKQMNSDGFLYWTQVGIVSWGIGCGNEDTYGYYTHVQKFRSWIDGLIF